MLLLVWLILLLKLS